MELNPVLRRELRVQWRGEKAFLLLFLLSAAMSLAVAMTYGLSGLDGQTFRESNLLLSNGRSLFGHLSQIQLAAWLLICPVLAAPRIAFERERGLLEAMQLSGLSPARVVWGKFASLVSFALLMLLVTAPPTALCFMMGGVAPDEFTAMLLLQMVTIYSGIALGLFFSARARRPQEAIRNTLLLLVIWLVVSTRGVNLAYATLNYLTRIGMVSDQYSGQGQPPTLIGPIYFLEILSPFHIYEEIMDNPSLQNAQNPYWGGYAMSGTARIYRIIPNSGLVPPAGIMPPGTIAGAASSALRINRKLLILIALATLLLVSAVAQARRVLPDPQWLERKKYLAFRNGRLSWTTDEPPAPTATQRQKPTEAPSVWEVPLASFIKFTNPVMHREVRGLMRLRHHSRLVTLLIYGGAAAGLLGYVWTLLWMAGFPQAGVGILQNVMLLFMVVAMIAAPLRGAQAIARERETGTWENLRLSQLTPREILRGKALAPLLPLCGLAAITAPLWFIGVLFGMDLRYSSTSISPGTLFFSWSLLFSTTFFLTCWGLWIAWRCRSATAASGWALGSTLVLAMAFHSMPLPYFFGFSPFNYVLGLFGLVWGTYVYGSGYSNYRADYYSDSFSSSFVSFFFSLLLWPIALFCRLFSAYTMMSVIFNSYRDYNNYIPRSSSLDNLFLPLLQCVAGFVLLRRLEKHMDTAQILEHETRPLDLRQIMKDSPQRINRFLEGLNHPPQTRD